MKKRWAAVGDVLCDPVLLPLALCAVGGVFVGFIDSIAGGGGLVSLPMLLALGMPPHLAIGTNKFAAFFSNTVSAWQFYRAGKTRQAFAASCIVPALAGAVCGSSFMVWLPEDVLEPVLLVILVVMAAFVLIKRDLGASGRSRPIGPAKMGAAAFCIGAYDGFAGPGAGTFMVMAFAMMGFDFVVAAGNAKIMAIVTNFTALVLLIYWQQIVYVYAVVLALSLMAGAYFGSRMAIRRGAGFIRMVMLAVTAALIGKVLLEYGQRYFL